MKPISLDSLTNELAKPGFERELIPLLMYRGSCSIGRYQRLWNLAVAMMMHEAASLSEGINHLHLNPEWSQLCFPEKRLTMMGLRGFFNRLRDNPQVTDLVPGLTEYAEWLMPNYWPYERVPLEAKRSRAAWWRQYTPKPRGFPPLPVPDGFHDAANGKSVLSVMRRYGRSQLVVQRWFRESGAQTAKEYSSGQLSYPFLIHERNTPEHELLRLINNAIPKHLPPDLRADMCQDLAIGCLTGDFNKDDLYLPAKEVAKRVHRMFPGKYGPLSLDAPVRDVGDMRWIDLLIDEGRDWA